MAKTAGEHHQIHNKKNDSIVKQIEQEISHIQDYRTRLIADAVTGKIDVRNITVPDIKIESVLEEVDDTIEIEEDIEESTVDNDL